jgi:hypothetical protein
MGISDKELIRAGKYQEALGENYVHKAIYVMIFEDGLCVDQLQERFTTKEKAIEWLNKNKQPLKESQQYHFGNINSEWL